MKNSPLGDLKAKKKKLIYTFWTAPRELMCTWQTEQECQELKFCAHMCATLWHRGLSLGSLVVKEERMLKRKQKKKFLMCCTPNMLEVLTYSGLQSRVVRQKHTLWGEVYHMFCNKCMEPVLTSH